MAATTRKFTRANIKKDFHHNWLLYVMIMPAVVFYVMFAYIPMVGNIMAFKEYVPGIGFRGFFVGPKVSDADYQWWANGSASSTSFSL